MTDTPKPAPATTHHHAFNFHTGRPRFHFDEPPPAPAAPAAPPAAPAAAPPAAPWYEGKADAETIGYFQTKGWDKDPVTAAIEASKAHRNAEKFIGAPADQLLRLPKDAKDEAGWKAVWGKLGAPAEAKDYDLSAVKYADGTAIEDGFADTLRQTAFANHLPKDAATAFAGAMVKFIEGQKSSQGADLTAKLEAEKTALAQSWGANAEMNKLQAMQGAKRLGVEPDAVAALEKSLGYAKVMEMFRKIGAATSEDTFIEGGGSGNPATREGAHARKAELMADQAWAKRYLAGGAAEKREMDALNQLIAGVAA